MKKKTTNYYMDKITRDERHYYTTPIGTFPGVTTICNIVDDGKSNALVAWAVRETCNYIDNKIKTTGSDSWVLALECARKEATRIKLEAGDIGKIVHDFIEIDIKSEIRGEKRIPFDKEYAFAAISGSDIDPDVRDRIVKALEAYEGFRRKTHFTPVNSETLVYSRRDRFGGTVDIVAHGKFPKKKTDKTYVIDVKTGTHLPNMHGMQLAAYAQAYEEMTGSRIEGIAVLHLDKNTGLPEFHDLTPDRQIAWKRFKAARKLWDTFYNPTTKGRR